MRENLTSGRFFDGLGFFEGFTVDGLGLGKDKKAIL
jgi:hypothetical protein